MVYPPIPPELNAVYASSVPLLVHFPSFVITIMVWRVSQGQNPGKKDHRALLHSNMTKDVLLSRTYLFSTFRIQGYYQDTGVCHMEGMPGKVGQ